MYHQPEGSQRINGNTLDSASGRFFHGADRLTNQLAAQLDPDVLHLNHVVESIDATQAEIVVATPDRKVSAGHVVLALPPALVVDRISFTPALPERIAGLAAATPVWMGAITKVVVHYETAFWRAEGLAGSAISHYGPMREIHDMSGPDGTPAALFGFVPGTGEPTVTTDEVVAQLVEIFGANAASPLDVTIQDWRTEKFTSPPNVEQLGAYQTYGHEIYTQPALDGRLHWSSTETAQQNPGHIEGALVAAQRAVANILRV